MSDLIAERAALLRAVSALQSEVEALRADAERWQQIGTQGQFWLENRSRILDAISRAGLTLMSNQHGFWLQKHAQAQAQLATNTARKEG